MKENKYTHPDENVEYQWKDIGNDVFSTNIQNMFEAVNLASKGQDSLGAIHGMLKTRFSTVLSKYGLYQFYFDWTGIATISSGNLKAIQSKRSHEYCFFLDKNIHRTNNSRCINFDISQVKVQMSNGFPIMLTSKSNSPFRANINNQWILTNHFIIQFENNTDKNYFLETFTALKMAFNNKENAGNWF